MNTLNNQSGYIQLSNDRSHLIEQVIETKQFTQRPLFDIYDIVMIVSNIILIVYIVFNFVKYKKRAQNSYHRDIHLVVNDKNSADFPFFQAFRKKPRNPALKKTQLKQQHINPTINLNANSAHNIVELKCTKCNYTTQIYEKNIATSA